MDADRQAQASRQSGPGAEHDRFVSMIRESGRSLWARKPAAGAQPGGVEGPWSNSIRNRA